MTLSYLPRHRSASAGPRGFAVAIAVVSALAVVSLISLLGPVAADAAPARVSGHLPNCSVAVAAASKAPREAPSIRLARATVCLINHARAKRGMARLRLNRRLGRAARRHTHDMVRRGYFGHVSGRGRDVVDRLYGSRYLGGRFSWTVGENLAWGSGRRGTPIQIFRAWMRSPGHRRNMLDPRFREMGIGVIARAPVRVGAPAATYTTTFGVRR